ncbi:oligosaccharide flippase family protein [soil metagenome]
MASGFFRNTLVLMTGSGLAQVVTFGITVLLARYFYTDIDFGVLALFSATQMIISVFANGRYDVAIMLPKEQSQARSLLLLSLQIGFAISLLSLAMVVLGGSHITRWVNAPQLSATLLLLPLAVWLSSVTQPLTVYLNRQKQYRSIATSKLAQAAGMGGVSLWLGYLGGGSMGLVWGFVAGQVLTILVLLWGFLKHDNLYSLWYSRKIASATAKEYGHFPKLSTWSSLLNNISKHVPVYLLQYYFGSGVVGQFSMSNRVLGTPVLLVSQSYGQIFYQHAAIKEHDAPQELLPLVVKTVRNLLLLGFLPILMLALIGPQLFAWVFGPEWLEAGVFTSYLSPWMWLLLAVMPVSMMMDIKGKLGVELLYQSAFLIARILAVVLGAHWGNALWAVIGFSAVSVLFNFILLVYVLRISKQEGAKTSVWEALTTK